MLKYKNIHILRLFLITITGIAFILGSEACDGTTPAPNPRPEFTLDIFLYHHAPEAYIDSSVRIAGYLYTRDGDTLSDETIYLSVDPDSVGNISPPNFTTTDRSDPAGFEDRVTFIARKVGTATISARFYRDNVLRASDSDTILVTLRGNE